MATSEKTEKGAVMSRAQFHRLCVLLMSKAQELKERGPSGEEARRTLGEALGFPVTAAALKEARQATGVTWEFKSRVRARQNLRVSPTHLELVQAVRRLYEVLGEPPPESLTRAPKSPAGPGTNGEHGKPAG